MTNTEHFHTAKTCRWPHVIYNEEVMREVFGIEDVAIPLQDKIDLLHALSETGLKRLTLGAFVSPRFVPQMACFEELLSSFKPKAGVTYLSFIHNQKAKKQAEQHSPPLTVEEELCNLFIDICDIHQRRNVNRSIEQIMDFWPDQIQDAFDRGIRKASIGVASAWGSNFMGKFTQRYRLSYIEHQTRLIESFGLEVHEIGLHDSQSWCLPHEMEEDLKEIKRRWPKVKHFHVHMHNGRGMALSCIYAALKTLDPSDTLVIEGTLGGLGGGQYSGNGRAAGMAATEDVMHMLEGMGIPTGVDMNKLIGCVWQLEKIIGRPSMGHVSKAGPRPSKSSEFYDANLPGVESMEGVKHFMLGPKVYEKEAFSPWREPIAGPYYTESNAKHITN